MPESKRGGPGMGSTSHTDKHGRIAGMGTRERFEYWYSDEGKAPKAVERNGEVYKLKSAQMAWVAWQAACNWQREHDADIALKVASSFGAPDAYWIFADTIRDQGAG